MKIKDQRLESFLKDLASKSPTPGGGVVAALSGTIAGSLIQMVGNLTLGKHGYEDKETEVRRIIKTSTEINKKLLDLLDEDSKAFEKVMDAYRMDKTDAKRKDAIKKSLKRAIEVPLEVRKLSKDLEGLAIKMGKIGNKNAQSDAHTAVHLSQAAQKSALENIKINKQALAALK